MNYETALEVRINDKLTKSQLIEEIESITQEELSDLPDSVYSELKELANTEWGKDHLELVIG